MKTTVELPDGLFREIKLKAVREGRKLKDTMADLLRSGLSMEASTHPYPRPEKPPSMPLVKCRHAAEPNEEMTPGRVAQVLHEQEVIRHAKARR